MIPRAVLAAWLAFLVLFAVWLVPSWPADAVGRAVAWLSALVALGWLGTHLTTRWHRRAAPPRDLSHEMRFELRACPGTERLRGPQPTRETWHGGHSHSGERPRFD